MAKIEAARVIASPATIERDRRIAARDRDGAEIASVDELAAHLERLEAVIRFYPEGTRDLLVNTLENERAAVICRLADLEVLATSVPGNIGEVIADEMLAGAGLSRQITRARTGDGQSDTLWRVMIEGGRTSEQLGARRTGERDHDGAARKKAQRWIEKERAKLEAARVNASGLVLEAIDRLLERLGSGTLSD